MNKGDDALTALFAGVVLLATLFFVLVSCVSIL